MNQDEFRRIIREELTPLSDKISKVERNTKKIQRETESIKDEITFMKQTMSVMVRTFDREDIDLRKRIEVLERRTDIIHS